MTPSSFPDRFVTGATPARPRNDERIGSMERMPMSVSEVAPGESNALTSGPSYLLWENADGLIADWA